MQLTELINALSSEPEQMVRGIIRIFHFMGLAMGLGAATLLDLMILRFFLGRPLNEQNFQVFVFCADIVDVGLKLLWVTGFGFLIFYWFNDPVKLSNEKVWAKMTIVAILTINGMFIHKTIIPLLAKQIGLSMLEGLSMKYKMIFVTSGIVSMVSWYTPVAIANLPHLNFQVPMLQILCVYGIILLCVASVAHLILCGSTLLGMLRIPLLSNRQSRPY